MSNTVKTCLSLALLLTVACGDSSDVAIRCPSTRLTVNDVIEETRRPAYEIIRNDPAKLVDAVTRALVLKHTLTAEPLGEEEREKLNALNRLHAGQECAELGIKKALASGDTLEAEARARFEADPQAFFLPESFRLQMIFIPLAEPEGQQLARTILREVQHYPERFGKLAQKHSRSETAAGGGFTKPMPGSAVHPDMRRAIGEHQGTDAPFLVETDRGAAILRVLDYWPPVEGSYEQVAATVRKKVGNQLIGELTREISNAVAEEYDIKIENHLFFSPTITSDTPVLHIDGMTSTAGDIIPGMEDSATVTGPVLRAQANHFLRQHEAILHFGCSDSEPHEITATQIMGLRLGPTLSHFVGQSMEDELERYFDIHREAFIRRPQWTLDMWVFPFKGEDRFDDLQGNRDLIEQIRGGRPIEETNARARGIQTFGNITLAENDILGYERSLLPVLENLEDGEFSEVIRSKRVGAFLLIRLGTTVEGQPMTPEDPGDRQVITARFIADNRDTVMDAFYEEALTRCRVDHDLMRQCIENFSEEDREPTS